MVPNGKFKSYVIFTGWFESTVQYFFKDSVTVTPRRTEHLAVKAVSVATALSIHFCAAQIKQNLYIFILIEQGLLERICIINFIDAWTRSLTVGLVICEK